MGSTVRYSKFDAKKLTLFYEIYDSRINNGHFIRMPVENTFVTDGIGPMREDCVK